MDSLPVILDISSDDDDQDYVWLSEVLNSAEKPPEDDSDDVVVISEVSRRKRAKQVEKGFDEDCVILDGDPEKVDGAVNEPQTESDELIIVGEKGQMSSAYKSTHQMMVTGHVCAEISRLHAGTSLIQDSIVLNFLSIPLHLKDTVTCVTVMYVTLLHRANIGARAAQFMTIVMLLRKKKDGRFREDNKKRKRAWPSVPKLPYTSYSVSQINSVPRHNNVQPSTVIRSPSRPARQSKASRLASSTSNPVKMNQVSSPRVRSHTKGYMAEHFSARNRNKNQNHLAAPRSNDFMRQERDQCIDNRYAPSQRTHERKGNMFLNALPSRSQVQSQPISHQTPNGREFPFLDPRSQLPPHDYFPLSDESNYARSDETLPDFDTERWLWDNRPFHDDLGASIEAGMSDLDFAEWLMGNDRVI